MQSRTRARGDADTGARGDGGALASSMLTFSSLRKTRNFSLSASATPAFLILTISFLISSLVRYLCTIFVSCWIFCRFIVKEPLNLYAIIFIIFVNPVKSKASKVSTDMRGIRLLSRPALHHWPRARIQ